MKLRLRAKIILNVVLVFFMGLGPAWYGIVALRDISASTETQAAFFTESQELDNAVLVHTDWLFEIEKSLSSGVPSERELANPDLCAVLQKFNNQTGGNYYTADMATSVALILSEHSQAHINAGVIMTLISEGNHDEAQAMYDSTVHPSVQRTIDELNFLAEANSVLANEVAAEVASETKRVIAMTYTLMLIAFLIGTVTSFNLIHSTMVPMRKLKKFGDMVAEGNLQGHMDYDVDDEIGGLVHSFNTINGTIRGLISELGTMATRHSGGIEYYYIDSEKYAGSYKDVIENINSMVRDYVDLNYRVLDAMKKYADGIFEVDLPKQPGKKIRVNEVVDRVSSNLNNVKESTLELVNAARDGKLDTRIELEGHKGGWADIINGLNELLQNIAEPLDETVYALNEMNKGNFTVRVTNDYKGQFGVVKNSLNNTAITMESYIDDINEILGEMADGDLTGSISRDFIGQFSTIKDSINSIVATLNRIISEINGASEELLAGAGRISSSSMTLSEGANTQAITIKELSDATDNIDEQLKVTVESAFSANDLSKSSMENALRGNEEMSSMLEAMDGIQTSSNNISNIIKVIEDISSQTNLLAINAAVEAARAGVHGKGFSVVAEEVRDLAAKSRSAAQETAAMIEDSMEKVTNGTTIANSTSTALNRIIEDINSVSEIVSKISTSTQEQTVAIVEMTDGLGRVTDVINSNSATSEESATAAEELNSQAIMLKEMVDFFKV